jgi:outer membrane lipoprotein-sorting protein
MHRRPGPRALTLLALFTTLALPATAAAAKHPSVEPPSYAEVARGGAQAILEMTDAIHFGYRTQEVTATLNVFEGDGTPGRVITMQMHQDGAKRLIRMLDPPEVKGMGILIRDRDTMYVYVPEFDKVRRIASHARKQTFLGSDFNYEDMAMARLSDDYVAEIEKESDDEVVLLLKAKPDRTPAYPKLRVFVDKKTVQMMRQEYFDEDGKHVRTQERSDMNAFDHPEYAVQARIKMIDHANKGHYTILQMTAFKADHAIPERMFSKRTLVRGE